MKLFFFVIIATPTAAATQAAHIRDAWATIFVMGKSQNHALLLAKAHLIHYGWQPGAVQTSAQPSAHALSQLDTDIQGLARKALRDGIASLFVTTPKAEGHPDSPATFQSLVPPIGGSSSIN